MNEKPGTLYLCATPIGNLEDMTLRAMRTLKECAAIAAEDTRHTCKLLNHFDIHTPLISYHEHNKAIRGPELIEKLLNGEDIAIVSDAGMPGISDPGSDLVLLAIEAGVKVIPLPGANAALSALICSGIDTRMFTFIGFLPKTTKKRRELIDSLVGHNYTMIFYESPHRLKTTLGELYSAFGDRQAAAARELTKKFEEFVRGTLSSLIEHFAANDPRGEFTLIVSGNLDASAGSDAEEEQASSPVEAVMALVADGVNKKDAIRMVALQRKISRRDVYQAVLQHEDEKHI